MTNICIAIEVHTHKLHIYILILWYNDRYNRYMYTEYSNNRRTNIRLKIQLMLILC